MPNETNQSTEGEIQVDRARLGSITVYDVTEDELETIERGAPSSNYLNFAIALLSVFISFLATLLTVSIEDDRIFMFFLFTAIVTFVVGTILSILWLLSRASSKSIFKKIRDRKNSNEVRAAILQGENTQSEES